MHMQNQMAQITQIQQDGNTLTRRDKAWLCGKSFHCVCCDPGTVTYSVSLSPKNTSGDLNSEAGACSAAKSNTTIITVAKQHCSANSNYYLDTAAL